ncbi:uncharacterized protein KRP23_3341 [Phytophthora ramorum]|uniref:uncharacterized protein n=1 Tax=Phytophthora ramorum TaxID=164328 RepID=UPI0030A5AE70|nr:hypothetical protein KRP23_3341 [Phytophthora ramorum]
MIESTFFLAALEVSNSVANRRVWILFLPPVLLLESSLARFNLQNIFRFLTLRAHLIRAVSFSSTPLLAVPCPCDALSRRRHGKTSSFKFHELMMAVVLMLDPHPDEQPAPGAAPEKQAEYCSVSPSDFPGCSCRMLSRSHTGTMVSKMRC